MDFHCRLLTICSITMAPLAHAMASDWPPQEIVLTGFANHIVDSEDVQLALPSQLVHRAMKMWLTPLVGLDSALLGKGRRSVRCYSTASGSPRRLKCLLEGMHGAGSERSRKKAETREMVRLRRLKVKQFRDARSKLRATKPNGKYVEPFVLPLVHYHSVKQPEFVVGIPKDKDPLEIAGVNIEDAPPELLPGGRRPVYKKGTPKKKIPRVEEEIEEEPQREREIEEEREVLGPAR